MESEEWTTKSVFISHHYTLSTSDKTQTFKPTRDKIAADFRVDEVRVARYPRVHRRIAGCAIAPIRHDAYSRTIQHDTLHYQK